MKSIPSPQLGGTFLFRMTPVNLLNSVGSEQPCFTTKDTDDQGGAVTAPRCPPSRKRRTFGRYLEEASLMPSQGGSRGADRERGHQGQLSQFPNVAIVAKMVPKSSLARSLLCLPSVLCHHPPRPPQSPCLLPSPR